MTQLNPPNLGSHPIFDRPALSLRNLLTGDVEGAGRAIWDPESLTPTQREDLAERWGVKNSILASVIDMTTNPLVLAGLLFTLKFPLPTAQQLTAFAGGVSKLPARFPWMKFISPVSENYHSTEIPGLLQKIHQERVSVGSWFTKRIETILSDYGKETGRRTMSKQEQTIVAALIDDTANPNNQVWSSARKYLEGQGQYGLAQALKNPLPGFNSRAVPEPLRNVATKTRQLFDDAWNKWLADPDNQGRLRQVLGRVGGFDKHLTHGELRQIVRYFPHVRSMTPEERLIAITNSTAKLYKTRAKEAAIRGLEIRQASTSAADRLGKMLPDPVALKELGAPKPVIDAVTYGLDRSRATYLAGGEVAGTAATAVDRMGRPIYYSLNWAQALTQHTNDMARAIAFSVPPDKTRLGARYVMDKAEGKLVRTATGGTPSLGERLRGAINRIAQDDVAAAADLENTVIPQVLGGLSVSQSAQAMRWMSTKRAALQILDKPAMKKALGGYHQKFHDWIKYDPGSSLSGLGATTSGWLYTSTLGAPNPVPAALNLLQPLSTIGPLGYDYLFQGYGKAASQMLKYAKLRSKGVPSHRAIEKAMPNFSKVHLELDPTSSEYIRDALDSVVEKAFNFGRVRHWSREVQSKLLSVFTHSEMFNRLASFEAATAKGLRELPGNKWYDVAKDAMVQLPKNRSSKAVQKAAHEFATEMTYMTQFGGGPLQRPMGTLNWWSPFAQFTTFPLRMASLVAGPMLRHPGYGGRAMLGAGAVYETARRSFDTDVSRGLIFGGLPEPSGYGPFPVLPIVPPALQLLGAPVLSAVTGESEHVRRTLPLLVPGGVGLARALPKTPGVGQAVGEAIERPYADWEHRLPDGSIPLYTSQGQLKGYYSETQLMASALGIGDVQGQQERELARYLLGQRDNVRAMKREYMEALEQNDANSAIRVQERYERMYPGHGGIPVKDSDIRSLHLREDVMRIERIMDTMPPELRDQYQQLVSVVFGAQYAEFAGMSGVESMTGDTISWRDPYRYRREEHTRQRVNRGLHGVKLREKLRNAGINVSGNTGAHGGLYYQSTTGGYYQP